MNFEAVLVLPEMAGSAQTHISISFIRIVWSTLYVYLCLLLGFAVSSPHHGPLHDPTHEWTAARMEQQVHPEKLKEVAVTVAGVILKQKMSDTNPLGRECKLEFVSVENFKNQVSTYR